MAKALLIKRGRVVGLLGNEERHYKKKRLRKKKKKK